MQSWLRLHLSNAELARWHRARGSARFFSFFLKAPCLQGAPGAGWRGCSTFGSFRRCCAFLFSIKQIPRPGRMATGGAPRPSASPPSDRLNLKLKQKRGAFRCIELKGLRNAAKSNYSSPKRFSMNKCKAVSLENVERT